MLSRFLKGLSYAVRGQSCFFTHPRLWLYALPPMLIVLAAYTTALLWLKRCVLDSWESSIATLCRSTLPEWLGSFLAASAWWLAMGTALIVLTLFLGTLYEAVGGPFFSNMVRFFEQTRYQRPENPGLSLATDLRNTAACVLFSCVTALLAAAFYAAGFAFPLVAQLLAVLVIGRRCGIAYCAESAFNRHLTVRAFLFRFAGRQALLYGFGSAVFLLMMVPFLSVFLIPGFVLGGTLLVNEEIDPPAP